MGYVGRALTQLARRYDRCDSSVMVDSCPAVAVLSADPDDVFEREQLEGIVTLPGSPSTATAEAIQLHLERTYCSTLATETAHLPADERAFFADALESTPSPSSALSPSTRRNSHTLLLQSHTFDHFMGVKFPTTKRYSLEGAEAMIPALYQLFSSAVDGGVRQAVLCMPHRGRLNVLVSLLGYEARALFAKVQGRSLVPAGMWGDCDVLSHISTTATRRFEGSKSSEPLTVSLLPNPSHLEAVNPVALGKTRSEQDLLAGLSEDDRHDRVMCIQLHGDAAFSGQGVVAEALTLAYLPGFSIGGTVHIVVNNQVGFTAGRDKSRSTAYSTDMGRLISCPVLHVNADDVDGVVLAARLAAEYRMRFHKDVIVDLIAYRLHGHNEVDEPRFTQPLMYHRISSRPTVVAAYARQLEQDGLLKPDQVDRTKQRLIAHLDAELAESKTYKPSAAAYFQNQWHGYTQAQHCYDHVNTGLDAPVLREAGLASVALPEGFAVHERLRRSHIDARVKALEAGTGLDWATAEALAIGSLIRDGYDVRMSGQDVERGTFSHRHAVLFDQQTNAAWTPLQHTAYPGRAEFISSNLSEFAVLAFEYGYSLSSPNVLALFEAQFGDFVNTAQCAIDNFLVSGETKWLKSSALTLLLPHGQEATGPEHVTARIERFLQLSNDDPVADIASGTPPQPVNVLIVHPTTPSQFFHLLRRQMLRPYRKPLVVIAPKVLLRHPRAVSSLEDMARGTTFQAVLGDGVQRGDGRQAKMLVLCSGKVYYDLCDRREQDGKMESVAIVRLEELSPFPWMEVRRVLSQYVTNAAVRDVRWVQEEPRNAGAWTFVRERVDRLLEGVKGGEGLRLKYVGRKPLPAAAVGSADAHKKEVAELFDAAFR